MADINIYYHKQTNSWWLNKSLDGFTFKKYMDQNPVGLGRIEQNTFNKKDIQNLFEIHPCFIPQHVKAMVGITEEIETNGFENAIQATKEELKDLLE